MDSLQDSDGCEQGQRSHRAIESLVSALASHSPCLAVLVCVALRLHSTVVLVFKTVKKGEGLAGLSAAAIGAHDKAIAGPTHRSVKPKGDLDTLRGACKNGVHLMAEVLGCRSSRAMMLGIAAIVKPIETRHNLDIRAIKTKEGRSSFNVGLACSDGLQYAL